MFSNISKFIRFYFDVYLFSIYTNAIVLEFQCKCFCMSHRLQPQHLPYVTCLFFKPVDPTGPKHAHTLLSLCSRTVVSCFFCQLLQMYSSLCKPVRIVFHCSLKVFFGIVTSPLSIPQLKCKPPKLWCIVTLHLVRPQDLHMTGLRPWLCRIRCQVSFTLSQCAYGGSKRKKQGEGEGRE